MCVSVCKTLFRVYVCVLMCVQRSLLCVYLYVCLCVYGCVRVCVHGFHLMRVTKNKARAGKTGQGRCKQRQDGQTKGLGSDHPENN